MDNEFKDSLKRALHYEGSAFQQWRQKKKNAKKFKRKSELLRQYGNCILDSLFEVANKCNIPVWIEFGTLLGAYRERGFIKHDFDLDVGMYKEDYTMEFENELYRKGFIKIRSFYIESVSSTEETITEVTFDYKGLQLDIFFNQNDGNSRYSYYYIEHDRLNTKNKVYGVVKLKYPQVKGLSSLTIGKCKYPSPTNVEEILEAYYGKNFMTPIKDYVIPEDDPCTENLPFENYRGLMKGVWNLFKL